MRTNAKTRAAALALLPAFLTLPLGSCFSERAAGVTDVSTVCSLSIDQLKQGGAFIPIRDFAFQIDTLRVSAGTRVTWVNCEKPPADPHTVTSDNNVWNSPSIPIGSTFTREFTARGTFPYHCTPHPFMHGVVIVQ